MARRCAVKSVLVVCTGLLLRAAAEVSQCFVPSALLNDTGVVNGKHVLKTIDDVANASACCTVCAAVPGCGAWTYHPKGTHSDQQCRLTSSAHAEPHASSGAVSGIAPMAPTPAPPAPAPAPPGAKNVLLLIADDLRPDLTPYGQHHARTPHLQALAARALRFDRAYCQLAVCAPSRNSILSGRRPDTSGVWNFLDWFRNETVGAQRWRSLPEYFRSHGYDSLSLGKTFHGCTNEGGLLRAGFCDLGRSWDPWSNASEVLPYVREHCVDGATFCRVEDTRAIFDTNLTTAAVAALRERSSMLSQLDVRRPFFLAVGFKKPHAPWGVPSKFYDQWNATQVAVAAHRAAPTGAPDVALIHDFNLRLTNGSSYAWAPDGKPVPDNAAQLARQAYYAAVSFVDEQVGVILSALDAARLSNDTIVVFTADHGYHLGEHGEWEKKANFELTTRVPLLIAAPHLPDSHGTNTNALTDLVDLYPTLVELAGLPPVAGEPGVGGNFSRSAAPLFTAAPGFDKMGARASQLSPRDASFSQYPRCGDAGAAVEQGSCNNVKKGDFKYMGYSARSTAFRYTAWMKWDGKRLGVNWTSTPYAEELYDHTADDGTDFDAFENENMLAPGADHSAAALAAREQLFAALKQRFASDHMHRLSLSSQLDQQ